MLPCPAHPVFELPHLPGLDHLSSPSTRGRPPPRLPSRGAAEHRAAQPLSGTAAAERLMLATSTTSTSSTANASAIAEILSGIDRMSLSATAAAAQPPLAACFSHRHASATPTSTCHFHCYCHLQSLSPSPPFDLQHAARRPACAAARHAANARRIAAAVAVLAACLLEG